MNGDICCSGSSSPILFDRAAIICYNNDIVLCGIALSMAVGALAVAIDKRSFLCRIARHVDFLIKEEMMKSASLSKVFLAVILGVLLLLPVACNTAQLGETEADGSRRHRRVFRVNQSELMADIDRTMLFDEPSRLTDKRIP